MDLTAVCMNNTEAFTRPAYRLIKKQKSTNSTHSNIPGAGVSAEGSSLTSLGSMCSGSLSSLGEPANETGWLGEVCNSCFTSAPEEPSSATHPGFAPKGEKTKKQKQNLLTQSYSGVQKSEPHEKSSFLYYLQLKIIEIQYMLNILNI